MHKPMSLTAQVITVVVLVNTSGCMGKPSASVVSPAASTTSSTDTGGTTTTDNTGTNTTDINTGALQIPTTTDQAAVSAAKLSAGVTTATGSKIILTGQLAISAGLVETVANTFDKIAVFISRRGYVTGNSGLAADMYYLKKMRTVTVDPTTNIFSITFPNEDPQVVALQSIINADGSLNHDELNAQFGGPPPNQTDGQIISYINGQISQISQGAEGGYLLIGMQSSNSKLAEASSFKYIGLPSGNNNLINLPIAMAKGNISLGQLDMSHGNDARAALPLDNQVFNLSNSVLDELAATSAGLKMAKNVYLNYDSTAGSLINMTTNYNWRFSGGVTIGSIAQDFPSPNNYSYAGYGLDLNFIAYPQVTVENLCGVATNDKTLWIVPPAPITPTGLSPVTEINNRGTSAVNSQYYAQYNITVKSCDSNTNGDYLSVNYAPDSGVYRNDIAIRGGPSGGFTGIIPTNDYWKVFYKDNSGVSKQVANFDFSAGYPLDANQRPKVYVPVVKLLTDTSNPPVATGVQVKFYLWDSDTSAYQEVQDLTAIQRILSELSVEMHDSGSGRDGFYNFAPVGGTNVLQAQESFQTTWTFPSGGSPSMTWIGIAYVMYGVTYNFSF